MRLRFDFHDKRLHIFLITALSILVYSNISNVPFVLDDQPYIMWNPAVKDMSYYMHPSRIDSAVEMHEAFRQNFRTRLVGYFTFSLNYKLNGFNPRGYHVFNLGVHVINALLLYLLVLLIFKTPYFQKRPFADESAVALITSLLFAVHPAQNQAVVYVSQRFASLVALFYLLSLVSYLKYRLGASKRKYAFYGFALLSMLLAMFTKENAFTLPFMAALLEFAFFEGRAKKRAASLLPFFIVNLAMPLVLYVADSSGGGMDAAIRHHSASWDISRWQYFLTECRVLITYLRLLFLPVGQNFDYDYPLFKSFLDPQVFLSFLFLSALFTGAVYILSGKKRRANPYLHLAGFGLLWFFITISIESSIFPLLDLIFEYRLYLPSAGLLLGLTGAIFYFREIKISRKAIFSAFAVIIIVFSIAAYARNAVWGTSVSLWEDVVRKSPMKLRARVNLGLAYSGIGEYKKAVDEYQKAIALGPGTGGAALEIPYFNMGMAYLRLGDQEQARLSFEKALAFKPDYVLASSALGAIYIQEGREQEGIALLEQTVRLGPGFIEPYLNLSQVYRIKGEFEKCMDLLQTALKINPESAEAHYELGMLFFAEGRAGAELEFRAALNLRPGYRQAEEMLSYLNGR